MKKLLLILLALVLSLSMILVGCNDKDVSNDATPNTLDSDEIFNEPGIFPIVKEAGKGEFT